MDTLEPAPFGAGLFLCLRRRGGAGELRLGREAENRRIRPIRAARPAPGRRTQPKEAGTQTRAEMVLPAVNT